MRCTLTGHLSAIVILTLRVPVRSPFLPYARKEMADHSAVAHDPWQYENKRKSELF